MPRFHAFRRSLSLCCVLIAFAGRSFGGEQPPPEKTITVAFNKAAWQNVFDWFSKQSGLTHIETVKVPGTLTFHSDRKYTHPQVLDLLNDHLAAEKVFIVRRSQSFYVQPADQPLMDNKVSMVDLRELKDRGDTELVQIILPLKHQKGEDITYEVNALLSTHGAAKPFGSEQFITFDRAKNIRKIIQEIGLQPAKVVVDDGWKTYRVADGTAEAVVKAIMALPSSQEHRVHVLDVGKNEVMVCGPAVAQAEIEKCLRKLPAAAASHSR